MKKSLVVLASMMAASVLAVPVMAEEAEYTIALCAKTEGIAWFDDMRTGVDEFNADHDDV